MTLQEAINIAKYSELSKLSIKDNVEAVVGFINMGLVELYGIFGVRSEEHLITLVDGQTIYELPDDFMYIVGAYENVTNMGGSGTVSLPINEESNPFSVNTIDFKRVQIPLSVTGAYVSIIYVPKPVKMSVNDLEAELPIPDQLIQPLMNFLAFKGHGAVRIEGQGEADIYYARFRRSCEDLKSLGISIAADDLSMSDRISTRGFV